MAQMILNYLRLGILFSTVSLTVSIGSAALVERKIEYHIGGKAFAGVVIHDSEVKANSPGVLVVHDWMGVSEKTIEKAREIAGLGYVALVADIYGKSIRPKNVDEARKQAGIYKGNRKLFREHLSQAYEQLKQQKGVDSKKIAVIGYCFGGTGAIELARTGANVQAAISVHGGLDSPEPDLGKNIRARVLVLHGADDPFVAKDDLSAFETEMMKNQIDWQLVKFGGAVHSFTDKSAGTDNSRGAAYNERADKRSWVLVKGVLQEVFTAGEGKKKLVSPFPSTVPAIGIPNTHIVASKAGKVLRGMAPLSEQDVKQLAQFGINEILIFRNDVPGETGIADELALLEKVKIDPSRIHNIPFKWKELNGFKEPCEQTVKALKVIKNALAEKGRGLFFHCTVGEDRTGYLAGLYRVLFEKSGGKQAFKNEMCAHGYAEANPKKPAEISKIVHENITPLYLKMLYLVETGAISSDQLDETVCNNDPGLNPEFQKNLSPAPGDYHCPVIPLNL